MRTDLQRKRYFIWPGMLALLLILAGCGGSSDLPTTTPQPTLVLSPLPSSSATPSTTDWTTYHGDNTRTGYVAGEPDPPSLARAWNTHLDGAVDAEQLVVNGHVIVATERDSLYSLDAHSGKVTC